MCVVLSLMMGRQLHLQQMLNGAFVYAASEWGTEGARGPGAVPPPKACAYLSVNPSMQLALLGVPSRRLPLSAMIRVVVAAAAMSDRMTELSGVGEVVVTMMHLQAHSLPLPLAIAWTLRGPSRMRYQPPLGATWRPTQQPPMASMGARMAPSMPTAVTTAGPCMYTPS